MGRGGEQESTAQPGLSPGGEQVHVPVCVSLCMAVGLAQPVSSEIPHASPLSEVLSGVFTGVSTPELFKRLPSFGDGAAVGEAEAWHLCGFWHRVGRCGGIGEEAGQPRVLLPRSPRSQ